MTLPETFTDALVRRLNAACGAMKDEGGCTAECEHIGWCNGCWERADDRQ